MSSTFDATAGIGTVGQARLALDEIMAWVGVDGLAAALRLPGLLAAVDQHTAAVRDAVALTDPVTLLQYARSLIAAVQRMGHRLPEPGGNVDWARAGWYLLRLVAVCALADEAGCL